MHIPDRSTQDKAWRPEAAGAAEGETVVVDVGHREGSGSHYWARLPVGQGAGPKGKDSADRPYGEVTEKEDTSAHLQKD